MYEECIYVCLGHTFNGLYKFVGCAKRIVKIKYFKIKKSVIFDIIYIIYINLI